MNRRERPIMSLIAIFGIVAVLTVGYFTDWNAWVGWLVLAVAVFVLYSAFNSRRNQ